MASGMLLGEKKKDQEEHRVPILWSDCYGESFLLSVPTGFRW